MIASLHKLVFRFLLSVALIAGAFLSPVLSQDSTEEKEAPPQEFNKEIEKKDRFFLGGKPILNRQNGPSVGKPKSILPQPFVPKGSIKVPAPPVVINSSENNADVVGNLDNEAILEPNGDYLENGIGELGSDNETFEGPEDETLSSDEQQTEEIYTQDFQEAILADFDPSGLTILSAEDGFGASFWKGYDRVSYQKRINDFDNAAGSPALRKVANKVILSGVMLEQSGNEDEVVSLLDARLNLIQGLGNIEGYLGLLEALPAGRDWSGLARHFTNAHLLKGNISDACSIAQTQLENDNDAYWLRMAAFCEAIAGNRAGVDFQLSILEEINAATQTFYQLIDKILIEAEAPLSGDTSERVELISALPIDLLEANMARLAGVVVPELALNDVNPLAVASILSMPGVENSAKSDLMGLALREGWAGSGLYANFARAYPASSEEIEAAQQLLADDPRFSIDAVLAHMAGDLDSQESRTSALKLSWDRALQQKYISAAGGGLLDLSSDYTPSSQDLVSVSILVRAALVAGDAERADAWYRALRASAAGSNPEIDTILVDVAPLMAVSKGESTEGLLPLWWAEQLTKDARYERANMLFTIVEALGNTVPETLWHNLEDGPAAFGGQTPSPALWRGFLISASQGDKPATLSYAYRLLSEGGTASVPASLAGSIVGTLNNVGLKQEAKLIALEILIAQGV